jgi:hypothetical protein
MKSGVMRRGVMRRGMMRRGMMRRGDWIGKECENEVKKQEAQV